MPPSQAWMLLALVGVMAGSAQAQPLAYGDFDGDGDVDSDDFAAFPGCLEGPERGLGPGCEVFDFDVNGVVAVPDFAAFQRVFGTSSPPETVLIPGGEFEMGDHHGVGDADEVPVHTVLVNSFHLDVHELSNRQYADLLNAALARGVIVVTLDVVYGVGGGQAYCDTTASSPFSAITWDGATFDVVSGREDHPMVRVSWFGAAAYCNWRSTQHGRQPCYDLATWTCDFSGNGYRLPTEAEWEYAARGGMYAPYLQYPWGDAIDGSMANYWESGDPYETGEFPETTPVGYYDGGQTPPGPDMANGYGLYDVAGNVWEWCNDWYDEDYYSTSPYDNPQGPATGTFRDLRGGAWDSNIFFLRCAFRGWVIPEYRNYGVGFRVAAGT